MAAARFNALPKRPSGDGRLGGKHVASDLSGPEVGVVSSVLAVLGCQSGAGPIPCDPFEIVNGRGCPKGNLTNYGASSSWGRGPIRGTCKLEPFLSLCSRWRGLQRLPIGPSGSYLLPAVA